MASLLSSSTILQISPGGCENITTSSLMQASMLILRQPHSGFFHLVSFYRFFLSLHQFYHSKEVVSNTVIWIFLPFYTSFENIFVPSGPPVISSTSETASPIAKFFSFPFLGKIASNPIFSINREEFFLASCYS